MPLTTTDWSVILTILVAFALIVGMIHARRMARLERKLDAILSHLGVGYVEGASIPTPSPGSLRMADAERQRAQQANAYDAQSALSDGAFGDRLSAPGEQVLGLLRAGNKIGAIKIYREQHPGMGLREAKEAVDAIQEQEAIR